MTLSAADLAARSGTNEERIGLFVELGILEPQDGGFRPSDLQRVRVAEAVERAGIHPEDLGRLIADGWFSFAAADVLFPDPVPLIDRTLEKVCEDLGLPVSLAMRALTAWAVPPPSAGDPVRADDRSILEIVADVYEALQHDEDRTIAGIRYFGENLRRIAESQMRWFRNQIVAPSLAEGSTQAELTPTITEMAGHLLPLAREALTIGYRRHLEHYSVEITVENIENAVEHSGIVRSTPGEPTVIAFVDLTGFTVLTEEEGDIAATDVAERLIEEVRRKAAETGGRAVKFMGDGAMLHYNDAGAAVRSVLDLVETMPDLGLPEAHAGINSGPVVFSDGDFFGRTVNLAARIAAEAGANQVLVAEGVLDPVPSDLRLVALGPVTMKGFREPVLLHHAVRAETVG